MLLCYVHGFLSGPTAAKAKALQAYLQEHEPTVQFWALDFPDTPREAFASLQSQLSKWRQEHPQESMVLVGSSMGGFFSTLLGAQLACKMVLLNPCTHPQKYFRYLIGPQHNQLTDRHFELTADMLPYLQQLDKDTVIRPELTQVYLGGQDEVLDYRLSLLRYNNCDIRFVPDEDHAFTHNFAALIPEIMRFAHAQ